MNLRDEIEEAYSSAEKQSNEPENKVVASEDNNPTPAEIEEVITAPNSYKQEYKDSFNTLPHDWQKYLASREKEMEQGLSRARNAYSWVDKSYNDRKDSLVSQGFNSPQEYFETLNEIALALDSNPASTIARLQEIYGVNGSQDNALQQQVNNLAQQMQATTRYLDSVRNDRIINEYNAFVNAKDDNGQLKHAYLEDVKDEMKALLSSGMAKNYEDAYNRAIWLVESVRNKILAEKAKADLADKAANAVKTKSASFNPSSKSEGEPKEIDLREEIARNYEKFNGE